jgi:hypothetical protein
MDGSGKRGAQRMAARAHQEGDPPGGRPHDARGSGPEGRPRGLGREDAVVELTLLLPSQQLEALEGAASRQEVTVGQLLRRLVRDGLAAMDDALGRDEA